MYIYILYVHIHIYRFTVYVYLHIYSIVCSHVVTKKRIPVLRGTTKINSSSRRATAKLLIVLQTVFGLCVYASVIIRR